MPDNMSFGEGAMIEPLAIAVYACKRAKIGMCFGEKVLITGAGPIGLLSGLAAKALGAEKVCITGTKTDSSYKQVSLITLNK